MNDAELQSIIMSLPDLTIPARRILYRLATHTDFTPEGYITIKRKELEEKAGLAAKKTQALIADMEERNYLNRIQGDRSFAQSMAYAITLPGLSIPPNYSKEPYRNGSHTHDGGDYRHDGAPIDEWGDLDPSRMTSDQLQGKYYYELLKLHNEEEYYPPHTGY